MTARFELRCPHCEQAFEYPARCYLEGGRSLAFPTVCLRCGLLGVHRAESRRGWRCDDCGSFEVHQLGFDPRGGARVVGVLLAVVLVGLPATSSVVWALPGLVTLGLLVVAGWLVERQGQANLARAPCSVCGQPGVRERRAPLHSPLPSTGEPVAADRPR